MAIPALTELQQYNVNRLGMTEGIRQSLYDFTTYDSAGHTQLTFFQQPIGQGGKTKADTNMESAGQLPQPKNFFITSIEVHFYPGSTIDTFAAAAAAAPSQADDVYKLMPTGYLDMFIGSKSYLTEAPIGRFPATTGLKLNSALASNSATVGMIKSEYANFGGKPYILDPGVLLVPNQNFNITLNWPAAVALPSGVDARIGVILNGYLYRNSQ